MNEEVFEEIDIDENNVADEEKIIKEENKFEEGKI